MTYNLYWGDIHNHCGISYAFGSLEDAFDRARDQLDFCSVTPHAFWHDMPDTPESIRDLCERGFAKVQRNWGETQKTVEVYNSPGHFITFLSYEWHSARYADHCVYYNGSQGPLLHADNIEDLQDKVKQHGGLAIPHHIGYAQKARGIDWACFDESVSPFVELYSMHGCSESDTGPYPMLHVQGPREYRTTAEYGLAQGHKFGFVGSTDIHSGYPGSWGDGRMAVYAEDLTRNAIWDAFLSRRTYAVTGDRIKADFHVNGAPLGQEITAKGKREVELYVETCDFLNKIEVIKNGRVIRCLTGDESPADSTGMVKAKIRIEWGWGSKRDVVRWDGDVSLSQGRLASVETCFGGMHILDPEDPIVYEQKEPLSHKLVSKSDTGCEWYSNTIGNPLARHSSTQAIILEVEMPVEGQLVLNINGNHYEHRLAELLKGSCVHFMKGLFSEAVRIHKAVHESCYTFRDVFSDNEPENEIDYYRLRVSQKNNQWAWLSPIWVSG